MKNVCEKILKNSLEKILKNDYELLINNVHEITITNILSRYIYYFMNNSQSIFFKGINVDIEYNRMLNDNIYETNKQNSKAFYMQEQVSKAIYITSFDSNRQDLHELIKIYVRPDIIIHQRGVNSNNILWLELKINTKESECEFDIQKAWYAISQLKYELGLSILVDTNKQTIIFNWVSHDKVERVDFVIENNLLKEKERTIRSYRPQ